MLNFNDWLTINPKSKAKSEKSENMKDYYTIRRWCICLGSHYFDLITFSTSKLIFELNHRTSSKKIKSWLSFFLYIASTFDDCRVTTELIKLCKMEIAVWHSARTSTMIGKTHKFMISEKLPTCEIIFQRKRPPKKNILNYTILPIANHIQWRLMRTHAYRDCCYGIQPTTTKPKLVSVWMELDTKVRLYIVGIWSFIRVLFSLRLNVVPSSRIEGPRCFANNGKKKHTKKITRQSAAIGSESTTICRAFISDDKKFCR